MLPTANPWFNIEKRWVSLRIFGVKQVLRTIISWMYKCFEGARSTQPTIWRG